MASVLDVLPNDGLEPIPDVLDSPSFVLGDDDPERFRIRYYRRSDGSAVVAHVWFGPKCQGPPAHAHGGSVAAVLDEVMGFAAWLDGHAVVAGRIDVAYRRPTPLRIPLVAIGSIERVSGRKVHIRGSLRSREGTPYATSTGLFVEVDLARFNAGFPTDA